MNNQRAKAGWRAGSQQRVTHRLSNIIRGGLEGAVVVIVAIYLF